LSFVASRAEELVASVSPVQSIHSAQTNTSKARLPAPHASWSAVQSTWQKASGLTFEVR
jgi:hypothetical protein